MSFLWHGDDEAPPGKMPVGMIGEAVERDAETETVSGKKITLNLFEKWREKVEQEK